IPVKPIYIAPRNPVVLCHGLYGFDVRGPEKLPILQVHYWRGIREALEKIGAKKINILGHSMGGLDARYLITHIRSKNYSVESLTTVCTPHRGSPFMDWCRDYLSIGYRVDPDQLIRDFATLWKRPMDASPMDANSTSDAADILGSETEQDYLDRSVLLLRMVYRRLMAMLDTPAYACLTTDYCKRFFNPSTPNVPGVEYLSIGAYLDTSDVSDKINPLIIPHDIIHKAEGPNDGFVSLTSAQWGHYLGSVCADHFD
ncbi:Alpha/Beta hydrolase protein, partial [Coemansia spiralis]